jgi:hypothetical protein
MFTHEQVWHGIDRLARERDLTASGLARRAGLDPTTSTPANALQAAQAALAGTGLAKILERDRNLARRFRRFHGTDRPRASAPVLRTACAASLWIRRSARAVRRSWLPGQAGWDEIDFPIWKTLTPMRSRSGVTTSCRRIAMVTSWSFADDRGPPPGSDHAADQSWSGHGRDSAAPLPPSASKSSP